MRCGLFFIFLKNIFKERHLYCHHQLILICHHHKGQVLTLSKPHYRVFREPTSPPQPGSQCIPGLMGLLAPGHSILSSADQQEAHTLSLLPWGNCSDLRHPFQKSTVMWLGLSFIPPPATSNPENPEQEQETSLSSVSWRPIHQCQRIRHEGRLITASHFFKNGLMVEGCILEHQMMCEDTLE